MVIQENIKPADVLSLLLEDSGLGKIDVRICIILGLDYVTGFMILVVDKLFMAQ